jgi:hypothetical protein
MGISGPGGGVTITKGQADGFLVKYKDSTHIDITAGIFETDGKVITLSANAEDILVSTIPAGFDLIYIYVDESESTASSAVFYDDLTEPNDDLTKRGWYHPANTSDRVVGVVPSYSEAAEISPFFVVDMGRHIRQTLGPRDSGDINPITDLIIARNMSPTGVYQATNDRESSVVCPVNAGELLIELTNTDAITLVSLYVSNAEYAAAQTTLTKAMAEEFAYERATLREWLALGSSRNIRIGGDNNDDNLLTALVFGYGYKR